MANIHPMVLSLSSTRFDVNAGQPPGGEHFCVWLDIELEASEGGRQYGGEVFGVFVCTPSGLAARLRAEPAIWGHKYLFVSQWSPDLVRDAVQRLCDGVAGDDWNEVVARLSRFLYVDTVDHNPYA